MGQSELLKIFLGIIIIGIALYVGLQLFSSNEIDADRNTMIVHFKDITANVMQYHARGTFAGGGGKTFTGYVLSDKLANTPTATYVVEVLSPTSIKVTGTSVKKSSNTIEYLYDSSKPNWWKNPTITFAGDFE